MWIQIQHGPNPQNMTLLNVYLHVSDVLSGQTGAGRCSRNHLHLVHLIQDPKRPGHLKHIVQF